MDIEKLEELRTEARYYGKHSEQFRLDVLAIIDAEIAAQSVTDQDVTAALKYLKPIARHPITANRKHLETAITALRQMRTDEKPSGTCGCCGGQLYEDYVFCPYCGEFAKPTKGAEW